MLRSLACATLLLTSMTSAFASPVGEWLVADRSARVAIAPCGSDLCGRISWSADGGDLGQTILIHMKPDGQRWTGTVVDSRTGQKYLAHIVLQDPQRLRLDGCAMGGMICSGEVWTRTR